MWGAGVDLTGVQVDSHNSDSVVVEHSRDIFGGEFVCCIADEKTSLSNSTVTNDDAPVLGGRWISSLDKQANCERGTRQCADAMRRYAQGVVFSKAISVRR